MQYNKTKPMIAAGVMAGILFVLNTINYYMPVLGILTAFVLVVPPAMLGRKYGIKWGILSVITSLLLQLILMGPQMMLTALTMAAAGIVFAIAYAKEWHPAKRFLVPSIVFPVSILVELFVAIYIMGIDVNSMWQQIVNMNINSQKLFLEAQGLSAEQISEMMIVVRQRIETLYYILPTMVVISGVLVSYVNVRVTDWFFWRFKLPYKPFPKMSQWYMPEEATYFFVVSLIMFYWGHTRNIEFLRIGALNLMSITIPFILVQGMAFAKYIFELRKWPKGLFYGVILLAFIIPHFGYVLFALGFIDMVMKFRKKHKARQINTEEE